MSGLYATIAWHEDLAEQQAADLAALLATRAAAPWHRIETVAARGSGLAAVWPESGAGWRTAAVTADAEQTAAVQVGGDAAQAARRLLELADPAHLAQRRMTPLGYAAIHCRPGRLLIASDRLGTHPVYLRQRPYGYAVATSALPLARLEPRASLDPLAVASLLTLGQLIGTRTLFAGIEALPAGAIWTLAPDSRQETRATWPPWPEPAGTLRERVTNLHRALRASIDAAAHPGIPGLLLSGGLDSRLLAALLVNGQQPPRAYTFGAAGCADIQLARRVASELRLEHEVAPTTAAALRQVLRHGVALTDGMISLLHFHGLELLPVMRTAVDV